MMMLIVSNSKGKVWYSTTYSTDRESSPAETSVLTIILRHQLQMYDGDVISAMGRPRKTWRDSVKKHMNSLGPSQHMNK